VRRSLVKAEARSLIECFGETYRLGPEFADALDAVLKATGKKASGRLDRQEYERERHSYRERLIRRANRIPGVWPSTGRVGKPEPEGYIEDLVRVESTDSPVQRLCPPGFGDRPTNWKISARCLRRRQKRRHLDNRQQRFGTVLGAGPRPAYRTDPPGGPTGAAPRPPGGPPPEPGAGRLRTPRDGVRVSPVAFLRSELRGAAAIEYDAMLRRWNALGGTKETLEGAISAGPYRLKTEPVDFNRKCINPALS
jgi:hypothetical protein